MNDGIKDQIERLEYSAEMLKSLRQLLAEDASETALLHLRSATELVEREACILRLKIGEAVLSDFEPAG